MVDYGKSLDRKPIDRMTLYDIYSHDESISVFLATVTVVNCLQTLIFIYIFNAAITYNFWWIFMALWGLVIDLGDLIACKHLSFHSRKNCWRCMDDCTGPLLVTFGISFRQRYHGHYTRNKSFILFQLPAGTIFGMCHALFQMLCHLRN